jgi:hypothetical protein
VLSKSGGFGWVFPDAAMKADRYGKNMDFFKDRRPARSPSIAKIRLV